jgi:hypothetical protein
MVKHIGNGFAIGTIGEVVFFESTSKGAGLKLGNAFPAKEFSAVMPKENLSTTPWANWGSNNLFPLEAANWLKTTHILNAIVDGKTRFSLNKGIIPVTGKKNASGDVEVDGIIEDPEIDSFIRDSRLFFQAFGLLKDYNAYRNATGRFMLNKSRDKIVRMKRDDVTQMRKQKFNAAGKIENIYLCADWTKIKSSNDNRIIKIPHVGLDNIKEELDKLRDETKIKEFAFTISDADWCNDYYSISGWWSAIEWVKIANGVPKMKAAMYENNFRPKYIVTILSDFWEKCIYFDDNGNPIDVSDIESRKALKNAFYDNVDKYLSGGINSFKAIFTESFWSNSANQLLTYIDIKSLPDNSLDGELIKDSSTAGNEIAFACLFSPSIIGASLPSGPYTNSQGGSNVREATMLQVNLHQMEREHLLSVMEMVTYYNKWRDKYPKLQWVIPANVPTTLDTGQESRNVGTVDVNQK